MEKYVFNYEIEKVKNFERSCVSCFYETAQYHYEVNCYLLPVKHTLASKKYSCVLLSFFMCTIAIYIIIPPSHIIDVLPLNSLF